MRKIILLFFLSYLFCGCPLSADENAGALTLAQCYDLALRQSETLAIEEEQIKEAEARFRQSLSAILPRVDFSYSHKRQDGSNSGSSTLREIFDHKFTFSQPLFSGFKEFAAMAADRAQERRQKWEYAHARQLLFLDVAEAFYLFLGYQQEYEAMDKIREALAGRVGELKRREELGRARLSEVVSVESRLRRTEAEMEFVKTQRETSLQLLEFLTGVGVQSVADEEPQGQSSFYSERSRILSEDVIEGKAEKRPDVRASREALAKSRKDVTAARGEFWPAVSMEGNSYTKRSGISRDVDWDVTWKAEVPLFEGGENMGKFREAESLKNQEELRYQETRRKAVLDIKTALTWWQNSLERYEAMQKALDAAEKNYQLQQEDYRLNLVNNLEVLQALEDAEGDAPQFYSGQE
jgi:outer membrane protein